MSHRRPLSSRRGNGRYPCASRREPLAIPQPIGAGRPLAHAQAEVEDLATYFPDAQVLAPQDVDRTSILRAIGGVGLLHASCHGLADPEDPLASGLELANGERFTLRELFGQPQDHLLVAVLSACQTNVPDLDLPDEAISLAAGMLMSGCRSVVASTWQVPDAATAELMREMYRRWREDGVALPDALRGAQRDAASRALTTGPGSPTRAPDPPRPDRSASGRPSSVPMPFVHLGHSQATHEPCS